MLSIQDIANDIHFSTHCILELTTSFDTTSAQVHFSKGIREQLTDLFKQIKDYQKQDKQKLLSALKIPFASRIYKQDQSLEMLITGLYVMVLGIERKYGYQLFSDSTHLAYANSLIETNYLELKRLL